MTKKVLEPNVRTADSLPISTPTCLILFVDSSPNCLVLHYELILVSSSPILGVGQGLSENRLPQKLIFNHDVFQVASLYVAGQNPSPNSWDLWMFIPKIAINHR